MLNCLVKSSLVFVLLRAACVSRSLFVRRQKMGDRSSDITFFFEGGIIIIRCIFRSKYLTVLLKTRIFVKILQYEMKSDI